MYMLNLKKTADILIYENAKIKKLFIYVNQ